MDLAFVLCAVTTPKGQSVWVRVRVRIRVRLGAGSGLGLGPGLGLELCPAPYIQCTLCWFRDAGGR